MRKLILFMMSLLLVVFLAGCGKGSSADSSKLEVVTTFNAMTEFVKAVGGDKVNVHTIIPDGTEPHDFELKADDVKAITNGKVLVYNGFGMEPWIHDAVEASGNKDLVQVEATKGLTPRPSDEEDHEGHDHDKAGHDHGSVDPHAWLSLRNAVVEVQNIADGLAKADPANADYYQANAKAYIKQLQDLDAEYKDKFTALPNHEFVTGHEAFGYLCQDYGLKQESVEDMFAEGEPNAAQLAKLVEFAKAHHIKTIFAEEMASPEVSKTLASEVGAQVETLYTMESGEDGLSYLDRMKSNLDKIYKSLQ